MTEVISRFFLEIVGREGCVILCSLLPIIELRGAIPLGAGLGLPWWQSYIFAVVGNMIPVPFILLFIRKILNWMERSKIGFFNRLGSWINRKAEKNRPKIEKYSFWGVTLFVAIPLPVTGAWTGSLVAATINIKFWKALLSTLIGVTIAGVVMTLGAYGVVAAFRFFA